MTIEVQELSQWQELASASFAKLRCRPVGTSFQGTIDTRVVGEHLTLSRIASTPVVVQRTAPLVRTSPSEDVLMTLQLRSCGRVSQHGRSADLKTGDAAFFDARLPYEVDNSTGDQDQVLLRLPRETLDLGDRALGAACARPVRSADPLLHVLRAAVLALFDVAASADAHARRDVQDTVIDLVASVMRRNGGAPDASRERFDTYLDYMREHLPEPGLGPASVAAAHFVSERSLYETFSAHGETPAAVLRLLRIRRAEELLRRGAAVTEVGDAVGFGATDTFIRAFRRRHGVTPGEWVRRTGPQPRRSTPVDESVAEDSACPGNHPTAGRKKIGG